MGLALDRARRVPSLCLADCRRRSANFTLQAHLWPCQTRVICGSELFCCDGSLVALGPSRSAGACCCSVLYPLWIYQRRQQAALHTSSHARSLTHGPAVDFHRDSITAQWTQAAPSVSVSCFLIRQLIKTSMCLFMGTNHFWETVKEWHTHPSSQTFICGKSCFLLHWTQMFTASFTFNKHSQTCHFRQSKCKWSKLSKCELMWSIYKDTIVVHLKGKEKK